ncbi:MAG: rhamnulokinase [Spirochaetota bacterium]|nr:rhamnulokinase [Spirochaetota bacterium]
MNNNTYSVSCDFGSSGGKIFLGIFNGKTLSIKEIHRFSLEPVLIRGSYYTNILYMWSELLKGLKKIIDHNIRIDSLGIDTWGVDYGYIDKNGELLATPINYRSDRTIHTQEKLNELGLTSEVLYSKTGINSMPYNTLFQVYEDIQTRKDIILQAKHLLFIPDLFSYWLTERVSTEYTIASTSGMINFQGEWDQSILDIIHFPKSILPEIQTAGDQKGVLSSSLSQYLGCNPFPVFASCSHDTASAVLATPLENDSSVFLSSGSWSLLGIERDTPILSTEAFKAGFTNELGINRTIRFLKSINGFWSLQLLQRQWGISFSEIIKKASKSLDIGFTIDITDNRFYGVTNIESVVTDIFKEQGKKVPQTRGEIASAIYHGLTDAHINSLQELSNIIKKPISSLHIVGGGSWDTLFCNMIAEKIKYKTTVGPVEGTTIGNILTQLLGLKALSSIQEARNCIKNSFNIKTI